MAMWIPAAILSQKRKYLSS